MLLSNGKLLLTSSDAWDFLAEKVGYNDIETVKQVLIGDDLISQRDYDDTIHTYEKELQAKEIELDYYSNMLSDTNEEIESIINYIQQAKRLNKQKVIKDLQQIYNNIYKNT